METTVMTIQEQIGVDLKQAMLQKNEGVKSLLRVVIGEFNRVGKEVSNEKATSIIKKMIDNAKEIGNQNEVTILESYVPKQLDEDTLKSIIGSIIVENHYTVKDMGKIMAELKERFAGQYDGKLASTIIKSQLQ